MKYHIKLAALLILVSLCGCMKTIHTHQQVMQGFRTEDDVSTRFGAPDEIMVKNGVTGWLYDCDTLSDQTLSNRVTNDKNYKFTTDSSALRRVTVSQFSLHKRYIVFNFNTKGDVLAYSSRGVSVAIKKGNPLATALLVTGLVAATTVIIFAATVSLDFSNWNFY